MTILFANNASTTIAGSITNVAVSVTLSPGSGALFPSPGAGEYFVGSFFDAATGLITEIVHCTARSGDTLTIVRAQEGTSAVAWNAGDTFANYWTAGQAGLLSWFGSEALFDTAGTSSWTVPPGVYKVYAEVWGGGGGSSGDLGSSGAGGGYSAGVVSTTPGASMSVVRGAAGVGNATPASVTGGGTSSFGGLSATGGAAGGSGPGAGGAGSGGTVTMSGGGGQDLAGAGSNAVGGSCPRGGFGGNINAAGAALAATAPGGGGGSNQASASYFQNGAIGWVYLRW